ncbi:MAG: flavin reductase family protein [Pseudomonadota bacterium]
MFYEPKNGHGLPHDPLKAIIAPRPIGWISSMDAEGRANLAPYSFFNGCGDHPALVMFSQTGRKDRDTLLKDSIANIRATGEFAHSVVSTDLTEAMNVSTGSYEAGVDEFERAGLEKGAGQMIKVPHVAASPVVLECRLVRILDDLPVWREDTQNVMVIGEVVGIHIRDEFLVDGILDVTAYNPIARMGYMDYTTVDRKWLMRRPGQ